MKKLSLFRQILILILCIWPTGHLIAEEIQVDLSEQERLWLENHGPLRVSNEMGWAPFNFNERGVPAGYSIDCINLVGEILNAEIEIVSGPSWNEFLTMLEKGEIDIILNIAETPQRKEQMHFTMPYSQFSLALFTRIDSPRINDIQDMYGMTFAVPKGFWLEDYLSEYPEIGILSVENTEEAVQAVSSGRADGIYDVMPVVEYLSRALFITNLQVGGNLEIGSDEKVDLRMAVGKDVEILRRILDKGIASIPPDEFSRLRNKWLSADEVLPAPDSKASAGIFLPIAIILAGLLLMALILVLLRKLITRVEVLNYRSIWIISILSLSAFVAIVVMFGWITVSRTRNNLKGDLLDSLNVILEATDQAVIVWIDNNLHMVKRDSENTNLRTLVDVLLVSEPGNVESRDTVRDYISGSLRWLDEEMYQIVGSGGEILVSNQKELEGDLSLVFAEEKERFERVMDGEYIFVPPINDSPSGRDLVPRMFFLAPIRNENGDVVAALARSDDPSRDFSSLVRMGHSGRTGETYAFNSDGRMISKSRFENEAFKIGLLEQGNGSILNLVITDPGVNLYQSEKEEVDKSDKKPTYMMSRALAGAGGQSETGYRDYRGVPVFGVWHWDTRHGFGIATEIDVEEGLESFYVIRNSTVVTLSVTVLLAVLVTLVSLIFGEKSNQALSESRSDLEEKVTTRTQELSQANRNLNNTIEALTHPFYVIDVKNHKVILANRSAIQSEEAGETTCYALTHFRETPCEGSDHQCPLVEVMRTKQPVQLEHIHNDRSGNPRYAEVHGYPILDEDDEVVQMIEYSLDITDRKKAEETTRAHLEELEQFNRLTIGREEKMIELKEEINNLLRQMNLPEKYHIVTDDQNIFDGITEAEDDE